MTKSERKEIFLQILENWFNDFTQEINQDNCIGFYRHFTFSLKFESGICVDGETDRCFVLKSCLDILHNFDSLIEDKISTHEHVVQKKALYKIAENIESPFEYLYSQLFFVYETSKLEYLK